jgi:OmpA-OmpF porin, OOP family
MTRHIVRVMALLVALSGVVRAQNKGFSVQRYEPTPVGEWTFAVDHPWYARGIQFFAAGLTFDYAHDELVFGTNSGGNFNQTQAVIQHALMGHVDLAASFLDRVLVSFSLPILFMENGTTVDGVSPSGAAVGDPRIGVMARLWGQPYGGAFSAHLGIDLWIPVGASHNTGDSNVRVMPKIVLAGLTHSIAWSFLAGYQYRPDASIGNLPPSPGNSVGMELKLGAALAYADVERRFSVGPELNFGTVLDGGHAFGKFFSSGELLLGARYNVIRMIEVGLAGGLGLGAEPGTPDGRVIFRVAYAPYRAGKPEPRREIIAPPPPPDRDHDGVLDVDDLCPDEPMGDHPDAQKRGCPLRDTDKDGVWDKDDQCVDVPQGPHPDKNKPGCPDTDTDGDGVFDSVDQCKDVPAGLHPDPDKLGCPMPDRDGDQIPDDVDACPDKPGAPNPDPKKNGCPGLVQIKNGQIMIMKPVFFATDKDVILPKSFPVLMAVADALVATPNIKRVAIEGHTDNRGNAEHNMDLSDRRARSVMKYLVDHGVDAGRLEAQGFGPTKPIMTNKTNAGRAANRRVEFHIIDTPTGDVAAPSTP